MYPSPWYIIEAHMNTNQTVRDTVKKSDLLNKKIIARCHETEERIEEITRAYNQPVSEKCSFVISFVGRFKTGKSSLINALIGAEILPTKATTATSVVTRIFYGKEPKCWLSEKDSYKEISIDEGKDIILNYKVTDALNPVEVIFELPIPWIKGDIELRDTPGMDDSSQDGKLEAIAINALKDTDLCVCVYDASTMISEKERTRTQRIHKMMSGNLVYAVNCTNRLNSLESVNQVDQLAKSFFGSMKYSISGMGKYYMICSAPKMIELDGFDKWLQSFVSRNNLPMLNTLRKNTGNGQVLLCREEFSIEAKQYKEQIRQQLVSLNNNHEELLRQAQRTNSQAAQNEVTVFTQKVSNLENTFVEISSSLRDKIQECKNKGTNYEDTTKAETLDYFVERYKSIIGNYGNYFSKNDVQFIRQAFQSVSFPGTHTVSVKATTGEKSGWAIAGGIIGSIFAPGIGTAIGAAIGAGIGASDSTKDDSVDNTMSFIRNTIVPLMRRTINDRISTVSRNIKNKGNQKCSSGLETIISETTAVQRMLNQY